MIHSATFKAVVRLTILAGIGLGLAACGGSEDSGEPLPTLIDQGALATQLALSRITPSAAASVTPAPAITASPRPSETPIPSSTPAPPSPLPTETPVLPPTTVVPGSPESEATGIALTQAFAAGVLPFTQTAVAVAGLTQTAAASITPSSTPTITFTPPPGPPEPYQIIYYTNRHGNDDLYIMTLGGLERRLTGSAANEREPSCSPDGAALVYASDASGSFQLYLLRFDQPAPVQLTNSEGLNFAPVFSPDGQSIAFVSTRNEGIPTIWMMNADGSNQRQITTEFGRDTSPAWGPDGRQLLFSSEQFGPWNLFITVLEEDVEGEFPLLPPEFSEVNQIWPFFDSLGERIVYTVWDNLEDPQTSDIFLLDFEEPEPRAIRQGSGADIAWAWADDTRLLASVGGPDDIQIALVDITTGQAVPLTRAGTFNGGARLCTVPQELVPPEPPLAPSPTPTSLPSFTPTSAPTATPEPSAFTPELMAAAGHAHVVQSGETLMAIGYRYGVNWADLADLNGLPNADVISIGQRLTVPLIRFAPTMRGGFREPDSDIVLLPGMRKEIVVDLDEQLVTAYENGRPIHAVTVSTGLPGTPTVRGEYSIYYKTEAQTMSGPGYYLPGVPWVMYFYQGYGLHGTYWHDNFGQPMSHGCVNLPTEDAKWLYLWAEVGTPVLVRQ